MKEGSLWRKTWRDVSNNRRRIEGIISGKRKIVGKGGMKEEWK